MSTKQETNSIEKLPDMDKNLLEDWKKSSRPSIQELQGDEPKSDPEDLEKIDLNKDDWRKRMPKLNPNISSTQTLEPRGMTEKAPEELPPKNLEEAQPETSSLPSNVSKKYLEVNGKFYFGHKTSELAFVDKGNKLTTSLVNRTLTSSLMEIAQSRNWTKIEVKGKRDFKREVWLEGSLKGINVQGYKPKEADYAELKKRGLENPSPKQDTPKTTKTPPEEKNKKNESNAELIRTKEKEDILREAPELKNEVIALHVADRFQEKSGMSKEDGKKFFEQVRKVVAGRVANGNSQPEIKIQEEKQITTHKQKENIHETER